MKELLNNYFVAFKKGAWIIFLLFAFLGIQNVNIQPQGRSWLTQILSLSLSVLTLFATVFSYEYINSILKREKYHFVWGSAKYLRPIGLFLLFLAMGAPLFFILRLYFGAEIILAAASRPNAFSVLLSFITCAALLWSSLSIQEIIINKKGVFASLGAGFSAMLRGGRRSFFVFLSAFILSALWLFIQYKLNIQEPFLKTVLIQGDGAVTEALLLPLYATLFFILNKSYNIQEEAK